MSSLLVPWLFIKFYINLGILYLLHIWLHILFKNDSHWCQKHRLNKINKKKSLLGNIEVFHRIDRPNHRKRARRTSDVERIAQGQRERKKIS